MNFSNLIKNLGKMQAGKWATRSAFRNPVLALAAGGIWLGYKFWQKRSPIGPSQMVQQTARKAV